MEEFRIVKGYSDLQVSNLGNIKCEVPHSIHIKNGRRSISFKSNSLVIAPLVAQAFPEICGEFFYGCNVHHKIPVEEGGTDCAENLIVLTQAEHTKIHNTKAVEGFYLGKSLGVFESQLEQKELRVVKIDLLLCVVKEGSPKHQNGVIMIGSM